MLVYQRVIHYMTVTYFLFAKQHLEADFGMWSVAGCQTGPCQQKRNCLYLCSMYALNIHSIYYLIINISIYIYTYLYTAYHRYTSSFIHIHLYIFISVLYHCVSKGI